ncbi:PD-(D/E)XK nuclease family protein [Jonesiaceae bacterium BS-20]|uniref:PD-(D/E)XK nuclease family protein n=1 Tax=Jonesiaceae bacterium BS-20 TaxID=3120821 RepID=A0AAU7E0C2_9MICO
MNITPAGSRMAWDGGALVVTSETALARVNKPHLSASSAKGFHGCPAKQAASSILPRDFDLFGAAERGSAGHLVLEMLYQLDPQERTRDKATEIMVSLARGDKQPGEEDYQARIGGDQAVEARWFTEVSKLVDGLFVLEEPAIIEVFATEKKLDGITVGRDVPFKGFIDRTDYGPNGLTVGDYKSGRVPNLSFGDDHGDQIRLYKVALETMTDMEVTAGTLLYLDHAESRRVSFAPRDIRRSLDDFSDAWDIMQSSVREARFETKPSVLCSWCPLVNACPSAPAVKAGPSAERALTSRAGQRSAVDLGIPVLREQDRQTVLDMAQKVIAPKPVEPVTAAHMTVTGETAPQLSKENVVTVTVRGAREEGKPWESTVNGALQYNSYASQATLGIATFAAKCLKANGMPVSPDTIRQLSGVIARTVLSVQVTVTNGSRDWGEGANSRIRAAVYSYITEVGAVPPFGQSPEHWSAWQSRVANYTLAVLRTSEEIFNGTIDAGIGALTSVPLERVA